jgi:hypothetical protein
MDTQPNNVQSDPIMEGYPLPEVNLHRSIPNLSRRLQNHSTMPLASGRRCQQAKCADACCFFHQWIFGPFVLMLIFQCKKLKVYFLFLGHYDDAKGGGALAGQSTKLARGSRTCKKKYRSCSAASDCCSNVCVFLWRGRGVQTSKGVCVPQKGVHRCMYAVRPFYAVAPYPASGLSEVHLVSYL